MKNMHAIRKLKYVCTTFMLIAILTLLNVRMAVGSPGPTISLTPSPFSGLVGSHVFLNIEVSDVTDVYVWQAYVTWDSSDLSFVAAYEGPFLKGNPSLEWESSPYDNDAPSSGVTGEAVGAGDGSTYIFYLDHASVKPNSQKIYLDGVRSYTFSLEYATGKLTFGTELVTGEAVGTGDGTTTIFYLDHTAVKPNTETIYLDDVVNDTYSLEYPTGKLTFDTPPSVGVAITANYANYAVEVGVAITADYTYYLLSVENPHLAVDKLYGSGWENTYASLSYSQIDGYFTVGNCSKPVDTSSTIQEVELRIRFSAAASTMGDMYRIVYYVGTPTNPGTKIVLVDWTSDVAYLETLVWNNVVDPQDGVWEWDDIWRSDAPERGLHFAVETDRVGGDSDAEFRLYEAWATVRHVLPTFPAPVFGGPGYVSYGSTLIGDWNGISGSGVLGFLEFEVVGTTDTALNFHPTATYIDNSDGVPISCTKVGSHFYPPIDEDVNADGCVDIMDLVLVGVEYGHSGGEILNPRADVYPLGSPDGVINIYDLAAVARKYGYIYS